MAYLCDKCGINPARIMVKGLTPLAFYDGLCGECCGEYLEGIGDLIGADKLRKVSNDR
jgi:hypothetical protein